MSKKTQRNVSIGATIALAAGYIFAVYTTEGIDRAELSLNDAGVWVTNQDQRLIGHVNYHSQSLDATERTKAANFDIFQEADTVLSHDREAATLAVLDPATVVLGQEIKLGTITSVSYAGGSLALSDPSSGDVWAIKTEELPFFTPQSKPDVNGLKGAVVVAGKDGSVHAISAQKKKWITLEAKGTTYNRLNNDFPEEITEGHDVSITSVGKESVVLDTTSGKIFLPSGKSVELGDTKGLALQEASVASDYVHVASATALYTVSLADGAVSQRLADPDNADNQGKAAPPVVHEGCAYAAWAGSGRYVRECEGTANDVTSSVKSLNESHEARFRTNRNYIVLNDLTKGNVWLPDQDMILMDSWNDVPNTDETQSDEDDDSSDLSTQQEEWERSEDNHAPIAEDDTYGVRPGRSTTLPVTFNDSDEDGDVLTVNATTAPTFGQIRQARDGQALQIETPDNAEGSTSFTYEANDGRGGADTAKVTVEVHPLSVNEAPKQLAGTSAKLSSGGSVTLQVLGDWIDPDGDQIYIKSASGSEGLNVSFRETGSVTITDLGLGQGTRIVTLVVSDGQMETTGTITVEVTEGANIKPRANGDLVRVAVGQSATIYPLANDVDSNGDQLFLVGLGPVPDGITAKFSKSDGSVVVSASKAGTRYLTYYVSDGPDSSMGVIRVDAVELNEDSVPVAENDVAMLPAGGQILVNVLENDSDPGGGVLILQSATSEPDSSLSVTPVNHEYVRVTAPAGLNAAESFTYVVSNGRGAATGRVTIIPVDPVDATAPPVLADDTLVVRAGDVGSVRVLENDRSPGNLTLTVIPELQTNASESQGKAFVSDNVVRFRAGNSAGSVRIIYTVRDSLGNTQSAGVNVTITERNEEANNPPIPRNVTVRAVVDQEVAIPVTLDGIDPEGDSVELMGLADSPSLGVVRVSSSTIYYTAAKPGTDSFQYSVRDAFGKTATARIRVGVAPAPDENQAPNAVRDTVVVRPNTRVSVPVISNDTDPEQQKLSLVPGSVTTENSMISVAEDGNNVVVTTPETEGSYNLTYQVTDSRGGTARGLLTVNVSRNAPMVAPIARDDEVEREEVFGKQSVTIKVLRNDTDPDGDISLATVSSDDPGVTVNSNKTLTIATSDKARIILYTVKDVDGLEASAIVRVPGATQAEPVVDTTKTIVVDAGKPKVIEINDYIVTRAGRSVIITDPAKVVASVGWNGQPLYTDSTTITFTAEEEFSGPTMITLEVTDGTSVTDSSGLVRTLQLPVEVRPVGNRPPVFTPTPVEIEAGQKISVSLATMTSDKDNSDDPERFTYVLTGEPSGVTTSINGPTMTIEAKASTPPGRVGSIKLTINDGQATVEGAIPVTVVPTVRPITLVSEYVATVKAGSVEKINVENLAVNPFPNEPLTVGKTRLTTGPSGTEVSNAGTVISVRLPDDVFGPVQVLYEVNDATNAPGRAVQGVINLTVIARPDTPSSVRAEMLSKDSTVVSWNSIDAHGSPIDRIELRSSQGNATTCGPVTQCTFDGLSLGDHVFEVRAHNDVGWSDWGQSPIVNLDVPPNVPEGITAQALGNGKVWFSWQPVTSDGSAVTGLALNVLGMSTISLSPSQTSYEMEVPAGRSVSATITASNARGSVTSASSNEVVSFTNPGPFTVSAVNESQGNGTSLVRVTWNEPATNGRSIEKYVVSVVGDSNISQEVGPGTTSVTFELAHSGQRVKFVVVAYNSQEHDSKSVAESNQVRSLGELTTPTPGVIEATGAYGEVRIKTPPRGSAGNGWREQDISYEYATSPNGDWIPLPSSGKKVVSGLTNGKPVHLYFRAVASLDGYVSSSQFVTSNEVTPYSAPIAGDFKCEVIKGNSVRCTVKGWEHGGSKGRIFVTNLETGEEQEVKEKVENILVFNNLGWGKTIKFAIVAEQTAPVRRSSPLVSVPVKIKEKSSGTYSLKVSATRSRCERGPCQVGQDGYLVKMEMSGYSPGETVTCKSADGSVSRGFDVDRNGGLSESPFLIFGNTSPAVLDSQQANPYDHWTCEGTKK